MAGQHTELHAALAADHERPVTRRHQVGDAVGHLGHALQHRIQVLRVVPVRSATAPGGVAGIRHVHARGAECGQQAGLAQASGAFSWPGQWAATLLGTRAAPRSRGRPPRQAVGSPDAGGYRLVELGLVLGSLIPAPPHQEDDRDDETDGVDDQLDDPDAADK